MLDKITNLSSVQEVLYELEDEIYQLTKKTVKESHISVEEGCGCWVMNNRMFTILKQKIKELNKGD